MHTILLLTVSNIFMTFAWYGHLKYKASPLWIVILASWALPSSSIASKCRRIASGITTSLLPN